MAKFALFTMNGRKLQEYEGDRMVQSNEFVQIIKQLPNLDTEVVAAIHLDKGQSVKKI